MDEYKLDEHCYHCGSDGRICHDGGTPYCMDCWVVQSAYKTADKAEKLRVKAWEYIQKLIAEYEELEKKEAESDKKVKEMVREASTIEEVEAYMEKIEESNSFYDGKIRLKSRIMDSKALYEHLFGTDNPQTSEGVIE